LNWRRSNWRHNDDGAQWIAPAVILNYGFAPRWELVVEGRNTVFDRGGDEFSDAAASLKTVFQEGSLQDKEGVSLGSEFSVLLPGIRADDGAGLQWVLLASDRKDWGAWHLNVGPMLTRDGRGGMVAGGILEGPESWPLRPVAEIRYEKTFGRRRNDRGTGGSHHSGSRRLGAGHRGTACPARRAAR
jgi:hypothetical protein